MLHVASPRRGAAASAEGARPVGVAGRGDTTPFETPSLQRKTHPQKAGLEAAVGVGSQARSHARGTAASLRHVVGVCCSSVRCRQTRNAVRSKTMPWRYDGQTVEYRSRAAANARIRPLTPVPASLSNLCAVNQTVAKVQRLPSRNRLKNGRAPLA